MSKHDVQNLRVILGDQGRDTLGHNSPWASNTTIQYFFLTNSKVP